MLYDDCSDLHRLDPHFSESLTSRSEVQNVQDELEGLTSDWAIEMLDQIQPVRLVSRVTVATKRFDVDFVHIMLCLFENIVQR